MRRPVPSAEQDILDALVDLREERIARIARVTKKGRTFAARWVRF